jgi:cell division transport system permease protein
MIGISILRIFRAAWQNFWRNFWLSVATLLIMVITLLMMLLLYSANVFGGEVLRSIERKIDLSTTFQETATEEEVTALAREIGGREDVEEVRIISSSEALKLFRERHQDNPFIEESLKELEENPLPSSMFIIATEPRFYQNIARQLEAEKYSSIVDEVNFKDTQPVIDKLIGLISTFKQIGLIVTIAFAFLAMLIMFNTVRLAIYSFREEIDIMRLVGASHWFIRGPFVIESIMIALIAVLIASAIVYPTINTLSPTLERIFFDQGAEPFSLYSYYVSHWPTVIGLQLSLAVGLAVISSWIGIRRYLRD